MARVEPPDPGLPIKLGPCGNGEFVPPPATAVAREAARRAHRAVEHNARLLGMSRRDFLRTSMGSATVLSVLAACSDDSGQSGGRFNVDPESTTTTPAPSSSSTTSTTTPASTSTLEPEAAEAAIGPLDDEFIFDVQAHLLEFGPEVSGGAPGFPQSACGEADPRDCYSIEHFLEALFIESDTHVVMLSAIPFTQDALTPEVMNRTIEAADRLGCADRVLMQGESFPTSTGLDAMADVASTFPIRAFKTFTHTVGPPWRLDDDVGNAYFAQVEAIGVPMVSVHKGFSSNNPASSPIDVGPAATNHPDVSIIVYHSGYEPDLTEGPYEPRSTTSGVNRLVTSLTDAGVGPGDNVYAELGSTWRTLMTRPDQAAHVMGKLLMTLGEDNILWGTDSIWYGSPQDQIEAFRVFEISEEFQETYGYPPLTLEAKRKILGFNAAGLFDIEPDVVRCDFSRDELLQVRSELISTHHTHADAAARTFEST